MKWYLYTGFLAALGVLLVVGVRGPMPESKPDSIAPNHRPETIPVDFDRSQTDSKAITVTEHPVEESEPFFALTESQKRDAFRQLQELLQASRDPAGHTAEDHAFDPATREASNSRNEFIISVSENGETRVRSSRSESREDWAWAMRAENMGDAISESFDSETFRRTRAGGIEEWYRNRNDGLQHGFTVSSEEAVEIIGSEYRIEISFGTSLDMVPVENDHGITHIEFRNESGDGVLNYQGLAVIDARGRKLSSRIEKGDEEGSIALVYDGVGAEFPIEVAPLLSRVVANYDGVTAGDPHSLVTIGDTLYFFATNPSIGRELWRSDGTWEGTWLVKDIHPGRETGSSWALFAVGETLFFPADDGVHGTELWKSDGTESGTVMVKDIHPGTSSSDCSDFHNWNGQLIFSAEKRGRDRTLWKSDGTARGTVEISETAFFRYSTVPKKLVMFDDFFVFTGDTDEYGVELWKSDGTSSGTVLIKDVTPGSSRTYFAELTRFGDELYFLGGGSSSTSEIWRSNGTGLGTNRFLDSMPGIVFSTPGNLAATDTHLYFSASTQEAGNELWVTDGTPEGTMLVKDLHDGIGDSVLHSFVPVGNSLFFLKDEVFGPELWTSDGTEEGTEKVLNPDRGYGFDVKDMWAFGDELYFADGYSDYVWKIDGTEEGIEELFYHFPPNHGFFDFELAKAGELVFQNGGYTLGVFSEDSREAATFEFGGLSGESDSASALGLLFFEASNGSGTKAWQSDGTSEGTKPFFGGLNPDMDSLMQIGNSVFFFHVSSFYQVLYRTDGTEEGTLPVDGLGANDDDDPAVMDRFRDGVVFAAEDLNELWICDGTGSSSEKLFTASYRARIIDVAAWPDKVYFLVENASREVELWITNGTESGTRKVGPNPDESWPEFRTLAKVGESLFFVGWTSEFGWSLWKTDGSFDGTQMIRDLDPDYRNSSVDDLIVDGSRVFFTNNDHELWVSDGTRSGTIHLAPFDPFLQFSYPRRFTVANGILFFVAESDVFGEELWRTDGTVRGTIPVRDIAPGPGDSEPRFIRQIENGIFFTANDGVHGWELWYSDGTVSGTFMMEDTTPGPVGGRAQPLAKIGDSLIYFAATPPEGAALRSLQLNEIPPVQKSILLSRPDLIIGKSFRSLRGDNLYQARRASSRQQYRTTLSSKRPRLPKVYLVAQNDSFGSDRVNLGLSAAKWRGAREILFTVTGSGRVENIVAGARRGKFDVPLPPTTARLFLYSIRPKGKANLTRSEQRKLSRIGFRGRSRFEPSKADTNELRIRFR